jgi:hypothetical protein
MIAYPAVIYSFLAYSISLVVVLAVNILNPFVLQKPPYNWSTQINGLINIPGLLGNLFGSWSGGNYKVLQLERRWKLTWNREFGRHVVQAAHKEQPWRLRSRESAVHASYTVLAHVCGMRAVWLRRTKYLVLGLSVLWIRAHIGGFDSCKWTRLLMQK